MLSKHFSSRILIARNSQSRVIFAKYLLRVKQNKAAHSRELSPYNRKLVWGVNRERVGGPPCRCSAYSFLFQFRLRAAWCMCAPTFSPTRGARAHAEGRGNKIRRGSLNAVAHFGCECEKHKLFNAKTIISSSREPKITLNWLSNSFLHLQSKNKPTNTLDFIFYTN